MAPFFAQNSVESSTINIWNLIIPFRFMFSFACYGTYIKVFPPQIINFTRKVNLNSLAVACYDKNGIYNNSIMKVCSVGILSAPTLSRILLNYLNDRNIMDFFRNTSYVHFQQKKLLVLQDITFSFFL